MSGRSRAWRIFGWSTLALGVSLVAFVVVIVKLPCLRRARIDQTQLRIENLERTLNVYRSKSGHYPPTAVGFAALTDLGVGDRELRDAWDNPFRYELVDGRPVITSFGADGHPGGERDAADLSNLQKEVSSR